MGTTTRILQLIDEKKLNFDTSVSEQVSEFRHPEVTVGHLLLHTSGLQGDFERKGELKDKEDRGMVCGVAHDSKAYLLGESGSAGIFSTLSDLMSFVEAYLQRDGRLFSEGMFRTILDTTFKDSRPGMEQGIRKPYPVSYRLYRNLDSDGYGYAGRHDSSDQPDSPEQRQ